MSEIVMGNFMRQHASQLFVIGQSQQPSGHEELAAAGAAGVDAAVFDYFNAYLGDSLPMVGGSQQWYHDAPETFQIPLPRR
jgi:hypothetical protein